MGKFIKFLLPLLCLALGVNAQEITRQEAHNLRIRLRESKDMSDGERIKTHLNLSHYYVLKPESRRTDLDSAQVEWKLAAELSQSTGNKANLGFAKWVQYRYLAESENLF